MRLEIRNRHPHVVRIGIFSGFEWCAALSCFVGLVAVRPGLAVSFLVVAGFGGGVMVFRTIPDGAVLDAVAHAWHTLRRGGERYRPVRADYGPRAKRAR